MTEAYPGKDTVSDRLLLLLPTTSYKAEGFLEAADQVAVQVVVGTDARQTLEDAAPDNTLVLEFADRDEGVETIRRFASHQPFRAIVGVDDETTLLAAAASDVLGLPHNPIDAVRAAGDKHESRRRFSAAGLNGPRYSLFAIEQSAIDAASRVDYPCVLKPLGLAASRGVQRADDPRQFIEAFGRIEAILGRPDVVHRGVDRDHILVEDYLPGEEVAVEAVLRRGALQPLALFDKPDPLEGPTFEETIYVTPSRLPQAMQAAILEETTRGCTALGLCEGPVHAELRLHEERPTLLEVAPRTIGGLCSRTLRFGTGVSLEELVLRNALGQGVEHLKREELAAGVMMIPIPDRGVLRSVEGLEPARAEPAIEEVTLTVPIGGEIEPLPEGHRYLGFIFARGRRPDEVESALRRSHAHLRFEVE
jgi:formate-dependent phosphoribosylglycinamide formyltransferase (GAR transformylase)